MRKLRELHLQLALGAACAQRKDVEDEAGAIDHAALELLLEIALLHAGEGVIEDDEVGFCFATAHDDFLDLALAGEKRRIGALARTRDGADDDSACRCGKRADFLDPVCMIRIAEIERYEQGAIAAAGTFKHQADPCTMARRRAMHTVPSKRWTIRLRRR
jgi:hypothetical protein